MEKKASGYLIFAISIFWFAFSFHWGAIQGIILPDVILRFASDAQKGTYLGIITATGAIVAFLVGPVVGIISDNSTHRWGKRRPFILTGILLDAIVLFIFPYCNSYLKLLLTVLAIQFTSNIACATYSALIPDLIPEDRRGTASGAMGLCQLLGNALGILFAGTIMGAKSIAQTIAPLFPFHTADFFYSIPELNINQLTYKIASAFPSSIKNFLLVLLNNDPLVPLMWIIIFLIIVFMIITLISVKEEPLKEKIQFGSHIIVEAFKLGDLKGNTSFIWLMGSRFFINLAISTLAGGLLLYYVKDVLAVSNVEGATANIMLRAICTAMVGALISGYLSDKYKNRKLFIFISCFMMVIVSLSFMTMKSYSAALVIGAVFGIGLGAFNAVDWALACDLLPDLSKAAKIMGIWNYASVGPQAVAPAIGGFLLDYFNRQSHNAGYTAIFSAVIIYLVIGTILLTNVKEKHSKAN